MMKTLIYIQEFILNEIIRVREPLYGKYDKVALVDNDHSYSSIF